MNSRSEDKLINIVLYILNKTGELQYYQLFKIMYFAERKHVADSGFRFIPDRFVRLPYGPVPEVLYQTIKAHKEGERGEADRLWEGVRMGSEDANFALAATRPANTDYLSPYSRELLDESIDENLGLSFGQLKWKSHDSAWNAGEIASTITTEEIAQAGGANEDLINCIKDTEAIERTYGVNEI